MRDPFMRYDISVWMNCGVGRSVRLAKIMETTHNAISAMLTDTRWNLSQDKRNEFYWAMGEVEKMEVTNKKLVEGIVLKSTKFSFHPEKWVRDIAKEQLKKFSLIYLSF